MQVYERCAACAQGFKATGSVGSVCGPVMPGLENGKKNSIGSLQAESVF